MTLSDIIYEVGELGLKNARLDADYKGFVNRAVRAIAMRRNWTFLHERLSVTMTAGTVTAPLVSAVSGATFKQLSTEQSPVTYTCPTQGIDIPVWVRSREEIERRIHILSYPYSKPLTTVFLELNTNSGPNAGVWTINLPKPFPETTNITFNVSCFTIPAPLSAGGDSNAITNHPELVEAVINRTRSIAYFAEDTTDKRGISAMLLYENSYKLAAHEDALVSLGGQSIHM